VNLANGLTLMRIILVPLIVWLIISDRLETAFILFLLAGVSDAADGYLAKNFGWRTEVGAYLDPIADKALLVSIYLTLGLFGHLPAWLVIAAVSRDISIVGAFMLSWMLGRAVAVKPLLVSKANTAAQILLAGLVLAEVGFGLGLQPIVNVAIWVTGGLIILSAAAYFWAWLKHMGSYEAPKTKKGPTMVRDSTPKSVERGERPRMKA
jgi:cardiolipin synthase (CMP-forming)